jgi:hypothetical protein
MQNQVRSSKHAGNDAANGVLIPKSAPSKHQKNNLFTQSMLFSGRFWHYLWLRPYGNNMLTPAVAIWLIFAWIIIGLMASLEGIVWGFVGASIVPVEMPALRPVAGVFMFLLMFAIIWIVDASFIMSERPVQRRNAPHQADHGFWHGSIAQLRWILGVLIRVAIVAVSLYVTAPFLDKLIRADDIKSYHQQQVEQYFEQRQTRLQELIQTRLAPIEQAYQERLTTLQSEVDRLTPALKDARTFKTQIETEYAPELTVLRAELADAQQRLGDELLGRNDRPEGYGPQAQRWEIRVQELTKALTEKETELAARLGDMSDYIRTQEQRLQQLSDELLTLKDHYQRDLKRITAEVEAEQPAAMPPHLTFATRSQALHALQNSPAEQGVPHFETVEGFAQAALGVLFCSLLALKLFEPASVRAYFNETMQFQYIKYQQGGLEGIPGFEPPIDPAQQLNPIEFAQLWRHYEADPDIFYADYRLLQDTRQPALTQRADQDFEMALWEQRQGQIAEEIKQVHRRRALELEAYKEELQLRTEELKARLADETQAQRDRRHHEFNLEIERLREEWAVQKVQVENTFREREQVLTQELEQQRLHTQELEFAHAERLAALRQAEEENRRHYEQRLVEQQQQQRQQAQERNLDQLREEATRLRTMQADHRNERAHQRELLHKLLQDIEALGLQVRQIGDNRENCVRQISSLQRTLMKEEQAVLDDRKTASRGFWSRQDHPDDTVRIRELQKSVHQLELDLTGYDDQWTQLGEKIRTLKAKRLSIEHELADTEARITETETRLRLIEDRIENVLV